MHLICPEIQHGFSTCVWLVAGANFYFIVVIVGCSFVHSMDLLGPTEVDKDLLVCLEIMKEGVSINEQYSVRNYTVQYVKYTVDRYVACCCSFALVFFCKQSIVPYSVRLSLDIYIYIHSLSFLTCESTNPFSNSLGLGVHAAHLLRSFAANPSIQAQGEVL